MNGTAEKDVFGSKEAIAEAGDARFSIGYGTAIFILVAVAVILAALTVYVPLLPNGLFDELLSAAKSYASEFEFDGTASGFAAAVSSLSSDELWWTLFLAVCPVVIFRKRLIYAMIPVRTFFLSLGLGLVLRTDAGTYASVAVSVSSAASLCAFVYSAHAALRFGDLIHTADGGIFPATVKFILKILSALGCYVITEILILLPSAFI